MPNARTTSRKPSGRSRAARTTPARTGAVRKRNAAGTVKGRAASAWTISVPRGQRKAPAALPGWKDLARGKNERTARRAADGFMARVSTLRFALLILAIAGGFTLYVGHVHATQNVLAELQQARQANLQLHLKYNRLKGEFDRATSPTVVYRRARQLGLEEGLAYGPTIRVDEP